jgi:hypothetical protein
VSEYASWALGILGRIEQALDAVHRRQVIFADFSPRNIIVREDGRICFLDFELASRVDEQSRLVLGSPGFMAPPWCSGLDIDRYALACLRLWIFVPPLTFLLDRDPTNAERFVRVLGERFPVPESFVRELELGLGVARDGDRRGFQKAAQSSTLASARFLDRERPDWTTLRTSVVEGIAASATPDRPDRLFPGDVNQFRYGGLNLAYGAAGVLYALATTGAGTDPEHVDWLVERSRQARHPHVGLYNGLHGVAYLLDLLGRHDDALGVLDHALAPTGDLRARGLFGGLAGIGLNLLHFARSAGEQSLREAAGGIAQQLACAVQDPDVAPDLPSAAGLMYGFSGPALLFIHLYEETGDTTFLDLAAAALRRDLAYCQAMSDGALQVLEGHRLMPYLSVGSAGIGLVLGEYLRHRDDEELAAAQACLRRACLGEFVLFSGLFAGRAGLIAYLSREPDPSRGTGGDAALERHLDRLALHALTYRGHVAFPGDQLLRLSMDLATGSAGVLLALHAALDQGACLPFLGTRSSAIDPTPAVA